MRRARTGTAAVVALVFSAAVVLMASRVGATARFVTWPVVAFTLLAATVAVVGAWVGLERPRLLAAGILPALPAAYVLPAAPLAAVAIVLAVLAVLAVRVRGVVAGVAMTVAALMVLLAVVQEPAVECRTTGVSANSGPWWLPAASSSSSSSGSSSGAAGGRFEGSTQVGDRHYDYACAGGRLTRFERRG